jgi:hypothetical protein
MPKLTEKYTGLGFEIDQFPSEVTLKHGRAGVRDWWGWVQGKGKKRRDIAIQRLNQKSSWLIFLAQGEQAGTLELPLTDQDKVNRVVARVFGTFDLNEAIQALADLGIQAKLWE